MAGSIPNELFYGISKTDHYHSLLCKEEKLPDFRRTTLQLRERDDLLKFILYICKCYCLQITTKHLAVQLLDRFLDKYTITESQLMLLAIGCLEIAAKYEEMEVHIPKQQELVQMARCVYSDALCMSMELHILKAFHWNIGLPTVAHFSECFETEFIDVTDYINGSPIDSSVIEPAKAFCKQHILHLTDLILKDLKYMRFRPSLVAASIIAATRMKYNLCPVWPQRLESFTGYQATCLQHPLSLLLSDYESNQLEVFAKELLLSGYGSQLSSASTPTLVNPASCSPDSGIENSPSSVGLQNLAQSVPGCSSNYKPIPSTSQCA